MSRGRHACRLGLMGLVAGLCFPLLARADEATDATALEPLVLGIAAKLDARVVAVLPRIDDVGGRLLALRSYLRSGDRLGERWSWTEAQIAAYAGSPEQADLDAEIQRVRAAFEGANPGYVLFVNPQVRSLDIQLANWNRNESVAAASAHLLQEVVAHFDSAAQDGAGLEAFLRAHIPEPVPTVAAPGLSPHGQMRAVDFQVHQGPNIVAGPDTHSIGPVWEQGGWAARLDLAIRDASRRFVGPLAIPPEPWHYTYSPVAIAEQ